MTKVAMRSFSTVILRVEIVPGHSFGLAKKELLPDKGLKKPRVTKQVRVKKGFLLSERICLR